MKALLEEQIKKTYGKDFDYPSAIDYDDGQVKGTLHAICIDYDNFYVNGTVEVTYRGEVTWYEGYPKDGAFSTEDLKALKGYYLVFINS